MPCLFLEFCICLLYKGLYALGCQLGCSMFCEGWPETVVAAGFPVFTEFDGLRYRHREEPQCWGLPGQVQELQKPFWNQPVYEKQHGNNCFSKWDPRIPIGPWRGSGDKFEISQIYDDHCHRFSTLYLLTHFKPKIYCNMVGISRKRHFQLSIRTFRH